MATLRLMNHLDAVEHLGKYNRGIDKEFSSGAYQGIIALLL